MAYQAEYEYGNKISFRFDIELQWISNWQCKVQSIRTFQQELTEITSAKMVPDDIGFLEYLPEIGGNFLFCTFLIVVLI